MNQVLATVSPLQFSRRSLARRPFCIYQRMSNNVHARSTFDSGGASGLYDRARPSYPLPLIDKIFDRLARKHDIEIVELGAGTGIFTRLLLSRPSIKSITAVEPSKGMQEGFKVAVIDKLPANNKTEVLLQQGTFTHTPAQDSSVDLVCIAQAFHWIGDKRDQHEAAMKEFARVLRPEGILAFIWNLEDRSVPWVGRVRDLYEKYEEDSPQYRLGWWKGIFDVPSYSSFASPETGKSPGHEYLQVKRDIETTEQGVKDRVLSKSYIQVLDRQQQEELSKSIESVLREGPGLTWIDKAQGTFNYPYATDLYLFRKQ